MVYCDVLKTSMPKTNKLTFETSIEACVYKKRIIKAYKKEFAI